MNTNEQPKEGPTPRMEKAKDQRCGAYAPERCDAFWKVYFEGCAIERELADALARERGYREALEWIVMPVDMDESEMRRKASAALSANPQPAGGVDERLLERAFEAGWAGHRSRSISSPTYSEALEALLASCRAKHPVVKPG